MPKRLKPTAYVVNGDCTTKCSLHIANMGDDKAEMLHGWYEAGLNDFKIEDNLREINVKRSHGAIGRHRRNHLTEANQIEGKEENRELSHVEMLEEIIKRGATQIPTWKVTPSEFFKAMDQFYKLTQGSAFEAMFSAMADASSEEDEPESDAGPESMEEVGAGPGPVREPLPVERSAPGSGEMADE